MKIIGQAVGVLITYLGSYIQENGYNAEGASGKALETAFCDEAFNVWVEAYADFIESFPEKLRAILMNLSSPKENQIESIWQKGLSRTRIEEWETVNILERAYFIRLI